jgi:hypothetical protein
MKAAILHSSFPSLNSVKNRVSINFKPVSGVLLTNPEQQKPSYETLQQ